MHCNAVGVAYVNPPQSCVTVLTRDVSNYMSTSQLQQNTTQHKQDGEREGGKEGERE